MLDIISTVWKILLSDIKGFRSSWLLDKSALQSTFGLGNIVRLSQEKFYLFYIFLQSIMFLKSDEDEYKNEYIHYYHTSFIEYMKDLRWSKDFYIYDDIV